MREISVSTDDDGRQIILEIDEHLGFTPEQLDAVHEMCWRAYRLGCNDTMTAAQVVFDDIRRRYPDIDPPEHLR